MNFHQLKENNLIDKSNVIISIDEKDHVVRFFFKNKKEKSFVTEKEHFSGTVLDEDFFLSLSNIVKIYLEKRGGKAILVLPDHYFFTDTIKLPFVNKVALQSSLTLAFNALYKNHKDLEYSAYPIFHDRKKIVFSIVGIRKDIRAKFVSAIENCGVSVVGITFTTNAMSNGAMQLNSKVKNQNCVVVDVKDNYSNLAFIIGGKTLGYFDIPFGANCFSKDSVVFEEDLFDHTLAQLLVLNAKEIAQKKKLTTLDLPTEPDPQENSLDDQEDGLGNSKKIIFKSRQNKNLPKFMTRDLPNDEKGFVYENFRYIIKRVLEAIKNNYKIEGLSEVKVAYFNLPKDFAYLIEMANAEGGDNVEFLPLHNYHEKQVVLSNLELFGASLIKKHNVKNNF